MRPSRPAHACTSRTPRRGWVLVLILGTVTGCTRHIEEEPPIPEHRIQPCESWCAMMFDPVCPAQDVDVPTEEQCVELCTEEDGIWAPVDGEDECAATYASYVQCLASLTCDEVQQHFAAANDLQHVVPPVEWSSCGPVASAQLDCQTEHY
jgi:hypothetical protein